MRAVFAVKLLIIFPVEVQGLPIRRDELANFRQFADRDQSIEMRQTTGAG